MRIKRNNLGSVIVEVALAMPLFLFLIFALVEFGRLAYIQSALSIAAQQAASSIGVGAQRTSTYNVASFSGFADRVRMPGAVISSSQFRFDVADSSNNSTVNNGEADGIQSTKVTVTVSFPPPNNNSMRVPIFDLGKLIGTPIFGENGIQLSGSATKFLERSRRPILN
ncbi:MAG: pilus assembly protein [Candidatus Melainabacteria bacterium]|nr:pilus assembly protein [Candidatus Melainabacteria bacterium]MBI3307893.1 pilus assembly protein [Candidatus Melainabacteria bacterium]